MSSWNDEDYMPIELVLLGAKCSRCSSLPVPSGVLPYVFIGLVSCPWTGSSTSSTPREASSVDDTGWATPWRWRASPAVTSAEELILGTLSGPRQGDVSRVAVNEGVYDSGPSHQHGRKLEKERPAPSNYAGRWIALYVREVAPCTAVKRVEALAHGSSRCKTSQQFSPRRGLGLIEQSWVCVSLSCFPSTAAFVSHALMGPYCTRLTREIDDGVWRTRACIICTPLGGLPLIHTPLGLALGLRDRQDSLVTPTLWVFIVAVR